MSLPHPMFRNDQLVSAGTGMPVGKFERKSNISMLVLRDEQTLFNFAAITNYLQLYHQASRIRLASQTTRTCGQGPHHQGLQRGRIAITYFDDDDDDFVDDTDPDTLSYSFLMLEASHLSDTKIDITPELVRGQEDVQLRHLLGGRRNQSS
ncbi:hypothetical protein E4U19_002023 [Claviceps sp. Clav32 group G5]|nr:hypothetical protein E4U19_002023 [Claviceps sp. Clav32 group G5]